MKTILIKLLIILISIPLLSAAQTSENDFCGITKSDAEKIKQRLLLNRSQNKLSENKSESINSIIYIPVNISIVGSSSGSGYIDIEKVLTEFCDWNNDYLSMDIQFYLKDSINSIRYLNNNSVYNDAFTTSATNFMTNSKVANCVNVYFGASVNNPVASYYSPSNDFIFMLNQMTGNGGNTGSHEIGHFFSLPHTFSGWEGITFAGDTAPNFILGNPVENVVRIGPNANCLTAADGFCDTDADYIAYRHTCPYILGGFDPLGVPINPNELNIMSYSNCTSQFSTEQADAVEADVIARGWNSFVAPTPDTTLSGAFITGMTPPSNTILPFGTNITLSWNKSIYATAYIVWLQKGYTTKVKTIVYDTSYVIPLSLLQANSNYKWLIKPINQVSICGNYSAQSTFSLSSGVGLVNTYSSPFSLNYISSLITTDVLSLSLNSEKNTDLAIRLFSLDGRQNFSFPNLQVEIGSGTYTINIPSTPNGVYILELISQEGTVRNKLVINR